MLRAFLAAAGVALCLGAKVSNKGHAQDPLISLLANPGPKVSKAKVQTSAMEDMVMALAKQAKAQRAAQTEDPSVANDNANISYFVDSIKDTTKEMMDNVFEAARLANDGCEEAYSNLSTCPHYPTNTTWYPEGFDGDFDPLRTQHKNCRAAHKLQKEEVEICETVRTSVLQAEQVAIDTFNRLNIYMSPEECKVTTSDGEAYLRNMREHFKTSKLNWWEAYNHMTTSSQNVSNWDCTAKQLEADNKGVECMEDQLELEEMACETYNRTEDGCESIIQCSNSRWAHYTIEVRETNDTIYDLKAEYRAIKRLDCLLDAFAADDMDAAIEACMQQRHSTDAVNSTCVANYDITQKTQHMPTVCANGITSIEHPNEATFPDAEYHSQGIVGVSRCYAICCTRPFYTYVHHKNTKIPESALFGSYQDFEEAKSACELETIAGCVGIYDLSCDERGTAEAPLKLINPANVDMTQLQESDIGSCVWEMSLDPKETTTTTTPAGLCSWEVEISRSGDHGDQWNTTWKTYTFEDQPFEEHYRFDGCTTEGTEGSDCVSAGIETGVRVLKSRDGTVVGFGSCCHDTTNKVLAQKRLSCDGFSSEFSQTLNVYASSEYMVNSEAFPTFQEAENECLRLGAACWGIMDDQCDGETFALISSKLTSTASLLTSSQGTCVYQKEAGGHDDANSGFDEEALMR